VGTAENRRAKRGGKDPTQGFLRSAVKSFMQMRVICCEAIKELDDSQRKLEKGNGCPVELRA